MLTSWVFCSLLRHKAMDVSSVLFSMIENSQNNFVLENQALGALTTATAATWWADPGPTWAQKASPFLVDTPGVDIMGIRGLGSTRCQQCAAGGTTEVTTGVWPWGLGREFPAAWWLLGASRSGWTPCLGPWLRPPLPCGRKAEDLLGTKGIQSKQQGYLWKNGRTKQLCINNNLECRIYKKDTDWENGLKSRTLLFAACKKAYLIDKEKDGKIFHVHRKQKRIGVVILLLDKIDFNIKTVGRRASYND